MTSKEEDKDMEKISRKEDKNFTLYNRVIKTNGCGI